MTWILTASGWLVAALLRPFRDLPAIVGLAVVSLLSAAGLLLIFKVTSDQARLEAVKRKIHACLFEIRLFNDDMRAIVRAQAEIVRHNVRYIGLSLVPLAWMIVPFVLLVAHLDAHYAHERLAPGDRALLTVRLDEGAAADRPDARLVVPDGVEVETPMMWTPSRRELTWRLRVGEPGEHVARVELDGVTVEKSVPAAAGLRPRASERPPAGLAAAGRQLLAAAERPVPASAPIESIGLRLPAARVPLFGWRLHWLIPYFVLTMVFAFALRRPLGVVI